MVKEMAITSHIPYYPVLYVHVAVQATAAAGAVHIFGRLLQSKNEPAPSGALLHIGTPSQLLEGDLALASSHAVPTVLKLVRM